MPVYEVRMALTQRVINFTEPLIVNLGKNVRPVHSRTFQSFPLPEISNAGLTRPTSLQFGDDIFYLINLENLVTAAERSVASRS